MIQKEQKELLIKAIQKHGVVHQLDLVIEEAAELIQAINKAKRHGIVYPNYICAPSNVSSDDETDAYENLCSELADVKIMIAQLEILLKSSYVKDYVEIKLERLSRSLK